MEEKNKIQKKIVVCTKLTSCSQQTPRPQAQKGNAVFLSFITTKCFLHHLLVFSHNLLFFPPLRKVNSLCLILSLVSASCLHSIAYSLFSVSLSSFSPSESRAHHHTHTHFYHCFIELKIVKFRVWKSLWQRAAEASPSHRAWYLKQSRSSGFHLKSSTTKTECAMMNKLLKGNACVGICMVWIHSVWCVLLIN